MKNYKELFPFFKNNPGAVYLDSACMGLKPQKVINSINNYYTKFSSCSGRAAYSLSNDLHYKIEDARDNLRKLINAKSKKELIFTRNTSESINILANIFPFEKGDRVIITEKEHNSNHCVWKELSNQEKIRLTILDVNEDNTFNMEFLEEQLKKGDVKLVSVIHVSNLDGIKNPVKEITEIAHKYGAYVLIDAAQSVPHIPVDVQDINADFMAFSIHKMYGPTGMGILYVKSQLFDKLSLYNVGGDTIRNTFIKKMPEYKSFPYRYEAGLQNYAGMLGAGSAVEFINEITYEEIEKRTNYLNLKFREFLKNYEEIFIIGDTDKKDSLTGITTFFIKKFTLTNEKDVCIGKRFNEEYNIMLRTGYFCVNPYFDNREQKGMIKKVWFPAIRVSFNFYNDEEDLSIIEKAIKYTLNNLKEWPIL